MKCVTTKLVQFFRSTNRHLVRSFITIFIYVTEFAVIAIDCFIIRWTVFFCVYFCFYQFFGWKIANYKHLESRAEKRHFLIRTFLSIILKTSQNVWHQHKKIATTLKITTKTIKMFPISSFFSIFFNFFWFFFSIFQKRILFNRMRVTQSKISIHFTR